MVGQGICFAHIHLKHDGDLFPSGIPNFKFLLDTEANDSDGQPVELTSAEALERYLRQVFGAGDREINTAMFSQARALCNERVTNTEGKQERRYTCNGCWDYNETHKSVINKILQTCAGSLEYVDGQFGLRCGAYHGPPDFTLDTGDIIGDISVQPVPEHQNLVNVVTGTHVSPLHDYQTVDFPEVRSAELIAVDGEELEDDYNLEFVHSSYQAQRLASIHLNRSRLSTVSLPVNLRGYECGLGRHIRLEAKELGYDRVEFMVEGWEFAHDKGVSLSLRQDYPELWDDYVGKAPTPPPRPGLPNPRECLAPERLAYSERQVNRVWESRLDWQHPTPGVVREYRLAIYQGDAVDRARMAAEYTSREPRYVFELSEQGQHMARLRAVNTFGVVSPPTDLAFWVDIPEVDIIAVTVATVDNSVYPCRALVRWQVQGDGKYPAGSVRYECETRSGQGQWLPAGTGLAMERWLEGLQAGHHSVRVRAVTPLDTLGDWREQTFTVIVAEQPQGLQFDPVNQDSYWGHVHWQGAGIRWELELLSGDQVIYATSVTTRSLYLEWQPPGSYQVRVRAVAGDSQSGWATVQAEVEKLQPPGQLAFKADAVAAASSGVLTWVAGDRRTEYHDIEVLDDDDRKFAATDAGSYQALPVLEPGQYIGRVRSAWRQSVSEWATTAVGITVSVEIPTGLEIVAPTDASYQGTLRWSGTAGSFGVRVLLGSEPVIETSVMGNQYRVPLLPVNRYQAGVRTLGTWSDSGWASIDLVVSPPSPPTRLTFTETHDSAASYGTLDWQASPSAGVSGYLVRIVDTSNDESIVTTQTVTTQYPVGNLPTGHYQSRVSALGLQGSSESEAASVGFSISALKVPINLGYSETLVESGTGLTTRVVFRWESGDIRTQSYDVEYRALDNALWSGLYSGPSATATINGLPAGDYWFRVRTLSYADSSGWSQLGVNVKGFNQPPANVENLQLRALGGQQALLTWNQVNSPDVINGGSVHVRHTYLTGSAAVWEAAVPLTDRLPGNTTFFSVPLLSGTYFVKAVNGLGFWSRQAASVVSTMGNMVGYNRVVERLEPRHWPGNRNKAMVDEGGSLSFSESADNTDPPYYIMHKPLDLGAVLTVRLYLECDGSVYEKDTIDERTEPVDSWAMFDGVEPGGTSLQYQVSQTSDDPTSGSASWSDWTQFLVGEFRARAFRLRISLVTESTGAAGTVSNLKLVADVPDRSESRRNISAPAGGVRVSYATPFLAPAVIGITQHNASTGDYWRISNSDEHGFDIRFYNSSQTARSADFDFLATSYGEQ